MYTLITLFYISLLGIVMMVVLKRHEMKTGRATIISRLGAGSDRLFSAVFAAVRKGFSYLNRRTFIALAQWLAFHVLKRVRNVYVSVKDRFISTPHGKKLIDAVRGRGEVKDHGASFYLRRISNRE